MKINRELNFEDLNQFWQYAMQESKAYRKSSRDNYDIKWSGGLTWEQAKSMAISGWRDGMIEIEKYRTKILPIIAEKVLRLKQINSISGYCVDVGSFLANEPECFISREYEERNYPGQIYKIVCSISFSAAITPETIIQRGAMICALIDAIEYAGHRAEVVCNDAMSVGHSEEYRKGKYKNQGWMEISVVVKKTSQPLEMTDLAFCLAHPAMLRRIMFSVAEIEGWSDFVNNYGYPAEATDKGDIYLREIFSGTVPDDKAIKWVFEELEKLGINIETD
jgi:hypothetical protein